MSVAAASTIAHWLHARNLSRLAVSGVRLLMELQIGRTTRASARLIASQNADTGNLSAAISVKQTGCDTCLQPQASTKLLLASKNLSKCGTGTSGKSMVECADLKSKRNTSHLGPKLRDKGLNRAFSATDKEQTVGCSVTAASTGRGKGNRIQRVKKRPTSGPNEEEDKLKEREGRKRGAVVASVPHSVSVDGSALGLPYGLLPASFCQRDPVELAPLLIGKHLRRASVVLQITEFGAAGCAYVYLCYGLHNMLNITADRPGVGAACLIRACAPVCGLEEVKRRRGLDVCSPQLLAGPGRVGEALGLTTDWSHHPLYAPGGLELLDGPESLGAILAGPRVGINYASAHDVAAPWRFALDGSPWVSRPTKTLSSYRVHGVHM
eukprot:jgi/Mesen1/2760/ME000017S02129